MNHKGRNLDGSQRELLGEPQARQLERNERWLAERLAPVELPAGLAGRLGGAVAGELARRRRTVHRSRWAAAAAVAAVLLIGSLIWLKVGAKPRTPSPTQAPVAAAPKPATPADGIQVAMATVPMTDVESLVDAYVSAVDENVVEMTDEVDRLDRELAGAGGQPWRELLEVEP